MPSPITTHVTMLSNSNHTSMCGSHTSPLPSSNPNSFHPNSSSFWKLFSNLEWIYLFILNNYSLYYWYLYIIRWIFEVLGSMLLCRNLKDTKSQRIYFSRWDEVERTCCNIFIWDVIVWSLCKFYMHWLSKITLWFYYSYLIKNVFLKNLPVSTTSKSVNDYKNSDKNLLKISWKQYLIKATQRRKWAMTRPQSSAT